MFGGRGRRPPVRRQASRTEQALSWLIVCALAGLGTLLYLVGQSGGPADASAVAAGTPAATAARLLQGHLPAGWTPVGQEQRFTAATLYEKIDGRAEQYVAYDVVGLSCVTLGCGGREPVDVYVYDMGAPLNAFGIFSAERPAQASPRALGRDGYVAASCLFFWKGRHYVQVLTDASDAGAAQAADAVAAALDRALPASGEEIWGLAALPTNGLQPTSVQYFRRGALGLDFLAEAFTATYAIAGTEVTAFVARHASTAQADSTLARYRRYVAEYGTLQAPQEGMDTGLVYGGFEVVFRQGPYIGGVSAASDHAAATRVAARLRTHLEAR